MTSVRRCQSKRHTINVHHGVTLHMAPSLSCLYHLWLDSWTTSRGLWTCAAWRFLRQWTVLQSQARFRFFRVLIHPRYLASSSWASCLHYSEFCWSFSCDCDNKLEPPEDTSYAQTNPLNVALDCMGTGEGGSLLKLSFGMQMYVITRWKKDGDPTSKWTFSVRTYYSNSAWSALLTILTE